MTYLAISLWDGWFPHPFSIDGRSTGGTKKVNFVVDADIKGFFDNADHEWLMRFLEHDIADKNFLRYIKRFLKAGIMEDMKYHESDKGTPQGGLISPVCANVYLHYVLDMWFDKVVKKQCKGEAHIVRYADDFICMFQYENEAKAFYEALEARLKKFNLGTLGSVRGVDGLLAFNTSLKSEVEVERLLDCLWQITLEW
ncbi:MAG: reverse transcriptase domain-containing protein [Bacillota bacterium]